MLLATVVDGRQRHRPQGIGRVFGIRSDCRMAAAFAIGAPSPANASSDASTFAVVHPKA